MIRTANRITQLEGYPKLLLWDYGNITGSLYQQMKGTYGKTGAKEKLLQIVEETIAAEEKEET